MITPVPCALISPESAALPMSEDAIEQNMNANIRQQTPEVHQLMNAKKALTQAREYLEIIHAEKIKYPEYIEFHVYIRILDALGLIHDLYDVPAQAERE